MIPSILAELESVGSTNTKVEILKRNESDILKKYLLNALDPLTNYYMRKVPEVLRHSGTMSLEFAMEAIVGNLSTRKITGNLAIEFVTNILSNLTAPDADAITRMIKQDLRCGVNIGLVNKAFPNLITEYPCLLATAYDLKVAKNVKFPAIAQTKEDGGRINAIVHTASHSVEYRSRNGKEVLINNPELDDAFVALANKFKFDSVVFDGEFLVVSPDGIVDRSTGNGIFTKAIRGTISPMESKRVRIALWDYITLDEFRKGTSTVPYSEKYELLKTHLAAPLFNISETDTTPTRYITMVKSRVVNSMDEVNEYLDEHYAQGLEGIILKDMSMVWEDKRSKKQLKFKAENTADLVVTGWNEGTGKYAGMLGSLRCESSDGKVVVNVSGWTDSERQSLTPENTVDRIVEVMYNTKIKDKNSDIYSLFLPRVVRWRFDKDEANSFEEIK